MTATSADRSPRRALLRGVARDPRLIALVGGFLAVSCWLSFGPDNSWQTNLFWIVQIPSDLLFCLSARYIARHPSVDEAGHRFWRTVAVAAACFVTGDVARTIQGLLGLEGRDAGPVQLGCFVVGQTIFVIALSRYPARTGSGSSRARFLLDAAIVVSGSAAAVWFLVSAPGGTDIGSVSVISGLLIGAEVLMVGFLAVKLILTGRAPTTPLASASMILAGIVQVALTAGLPLFASPRHYGLLLSVQLLPGVFIALGPLLQTIELRVTPAARRVMRPRPYSLLPYAAVGIVYALLLIALFTDGTLNARTWGMVVAVGIVTALVVWRQLLSATENAQLIKQLDESFRDLHEQKEWFSSLVAHSSDIATVSDANNVITWASPAVDRALGLRPDQVVGTSFIAYMHPDDVARLAADWREMMTVPGRALTSQYRLKSADRGWRWVETINTNLLGDPAIRGVVSNGRDITDARELQEKLIHQASHDVLTRLANRRLFAERLADVRPGSEGSARAALLMIDLDGFKPINDTHGHHVGDAVLLAVAERISRCVREGDTAARLGGDEFAVLMPGASLDEATTVAERFRAALAEPVTIGGLRLTIGASVGITVGDAGDPEALMRTADAEMYAVKHRDGPAAVRLASSGVRSD